MRYTFDPDASTLRIDASSSIHPIHTTTPVTGWLEVTFTEGGAIEPDAELGGYVEFGLATMRSGNPLVDREAERRLDVRRYPTVAGELTVLAATDDPATFHAEGELTFHGVTRTIGGTLRIDPTTDGGLALSGTTTIDVTDFGVQPPSLLVVKVHKDVTIELSAQADPTS